MKSSKTQNQTLSTKELAELLSVTSGRIRQIALSLSLERKGRDWLFSHEDVEKIAAHTQVGQAEIIFNSIENKAK